MALNRNMNKTFPLHNKLLLCVCAKYGPAKSSSDFRISLSPKQFISNQRPFSSFRAYRRSFKCNLVFGGFSYLPSAASAPGQPRQFQRYFESIVFFSLVDLSIYVFATTIYFVTLHSPQA